MKKIKDASFTMQNVPITLSAMTEGPNQRNLYVESCCPHITHHSGTGYHIVATVKKVSVKTPKNEVILLDSQET